MRQLNKALYITALLLSAHQTNALEINAGGGYDTNPFELSGQNDGGLFTDLNINHAGKTPVLKKSELRYNATLKGRLYESAFDDADYYSLDLRGRFVHRFKIGERTANFLLTTDWKSDRRTYFSQSQRAVATSGGNSISDRFDYDSPKLAAELIYRLNKVHSLSLYSYVSSRNYLEDYEDIGLEGLDYYEYSFQPTYRYKNANGLNARAFVYYRKRMYEDLLEDDITGANIFGEKLRYDFYGYGVTAKSPITEKLSVNAYANGYFIRDGAAGFRDFDFHQLRVGLDYQIKKNQKISAQGSCYIRDFLLDVAAPVESETGYAGRLRKGCKAEAVYSAPFIKLETEKLLWHAKLGTEIESNSAQNLSFDKFFALLSISFEF